MKTGDKKVFSILRHSKINEQTKTGFPQALWTGMSQICCCSFHFELLIPVHVPLLPKRLVQHEHSSSHRD